MVKIKYHVLYIEFQEMGIPLVHSFIRIFNSSNIQNEDVYNYFIEKAVNAELPDHLNDHIY